MIELFAGGTRWTKTEASSLCSPALKWVTGCRRGEQRLEAFCFPELAAPLIGPCFLACLHPACSETGRKKLEPGARRSPQRELDPEAGVVRTSRRGLSLRRTMLEGLAPLLHRETLNSLRRVWVSCRPKTFTTLQP